MKRVEIELPDTLAAEAAEAGLLAPESMERMLRESMRQVRVDRFKEIMGLLDDEPPPGLEEVINVEIAADRAERRASRP